MLMLALFVACQEEPDALALDVGGPPAPSLAVPAYFYPGPLWSRMGQARPAVVVANPASGPGAAADPAYAGVISAARAHGTQVIGYVSTAYGNRPLAAVQADIDAWYAFYDVDGVFLDEGPGTATCAALAGHYQGVASAVRAHDPAAYVALNPGTDTCESYLGFITTLLVFEDTAQRFATWTAPAWMANYGADRFWILTLSTPRARMPAVIRRAATQGVGLVYVTDDVLPNPWDTLPPYWAQEASLTAP